jgi:Zn-dependent metalloprotease
VLGCAPAAVHVSSPDESRALDGSVGSQVIVPPSTTMTEASFVSWLRTALSLSTNSTLVRLGEAPSLTGQTYARYEHQYGGLTVEGEGVTVFTKDGYVTRGFGAATGGWTSATKAKTAASTVLSKAEAAVKAELNASTVTWHTTLSHTCTLVIARPPRASFTLVHRCQMVALRPAAAYSVLVDDATATAYSSIPQYRAAWQPAIASGVSVYNGQTGPFAAEMDDQTAVFRLHAPKFITRDAVGATGNPTPSTSIDYESLSSYFSGSLSPGASVHWGAQKAYEHLSQRFGVDPFFAPLDMSKTLTSLNVYANASIVGAYYWQPEALMVFGNEGVEWVELDIAGHEMGHVLEVQKHIIGDYYNEPGERGAIVESFADIMGQLVEAAVLGSSDWIAASHVPPLFGKYRDLSNPLQSQVCVDDTNCTPQTIQGQPDVYLGPLNWVPVVAPFNNANDFGGEHVNSSVQSLWFYLLALGSSGPKTNSNGTTYTVAPIGIDTAAKILYAGVIETTSNADKYPQVAQAFQLAADTFCGTLSEASISTTNALHAVGLASAASTVVPSSLPADNATNVHPFAYTFKWQHTLGGYTESSWKVQFSKDPTFPPNATVATTSTAVDGANGYVSNVSLEPGAIYYWRVASTSPDPALHCWRPVRKFTTSTSIPQPISPKLSQGSVHPWQLPFAFVGVSRATEYDIQVAYSQAVDQGGNPTEQVFATQTFPASALGGDPDKTVEITAPVQKDLFWRVRARSGSNATPYSSFTGFVTHTPQAQALAPNGAAGLDPWPVTFDFKPLKGAEQTWRLTATGQNLTKTNLTGSTYSRNISGELNNDPITWWMDKPLGPNWGGSPTVSNREWGLASPTVTFTTNGMLTAINPSSSSFVPQWPSCMDPSLQYLHWPMPHPKAAEYEVKVYESSCPDPLPPSGCNLSIQRLSATQSHVTTADQVQGRNLGSLLPLSSDLNPGFFWYVQAFTSDGVSGWYAAQGASHINPPAPALQSPSANSEITTNNGDVVFTWSSQHTHGGKFILTVYKGSTCSNIDAQFVVSGASHGVTSTLLHSTDWEPQALNSNGPALQSWDVRPNAFSPCSGSYVSTCRSFTVKSVPSSQPPGVPPETPSGGNVALPGTANDYVTGFAYWGPAAFADSYTLDVYQCPYTTKAACSNIPDNQKTTFPAGAFHLDATVWVARQEIFETWIQANVDSAFQFPGAHWTDIDGTSSQTQYFYRVKAHNSYGSSTWGVWYVTGPGGYADE